MRGLGIHGVLHELEDPLCVTNNPACHVSARLMSSAWDRRRSWFFLLPPA